MGKLEKVIVENGITYVLGEDDICMRLMRNEP